MPSVYQELPPPTQPPDMANAEIQPVADNRPIVFNRGRPTTVEEKLDHIINMLGAMKMEIEDLKWNKQNGYPGTALQVTDSDLNLPIKSIEELQTFETQVINDPDLKQKLVQYLQHFGGMSAKDLHTRCYKRLFTNALCEECSWKGFRKNFKMEDLTVTKCLYDAVNGTFPTTLKEFELLTRDYLRHAKQRKERELNKR
ncbi:hypothetical protein RN001_005685 [Aquatica leii]|uniref:DUF4806 domain-containing protein n=1 Tax=Aquatica leii TaxID=1421715 RepID=A0AAN7PK81_9COLE|nr:hypothetical protein RN001_005685 [Aquatica leii]